MVCGMEGRTATQSLASHLLQEPVEDVVRRLRDQGYSWQQVADKIANDTDGIVSVNRETYRLWYGSSPKETQP